MNKKAALDCLDRIRKLAYTPGPPYKEPFREEDFVSIRQALTSVPAEDVREAMEEQFDELFHAEFQKQAKTSREYHGVIALASSPFFEIAEKVFRAASSPPMPKMGEDVRAPEQQLINCQENLQKETLLSSAPFNEGTQLALQIATLKAQSMAATPKMQTAAILDVLRAAFFDENGTAVERDDVYFIYRALKEKDIL